MLFKSSVFFNLSYFDFFLLYFFASNQNKLQFLVSPFCRLHIFFAIKFSNYFIIKLSNYLSAVKLSFSKVHSSYFNVISKISKKHNIYVYLINQKIFINMFKNIIQLLYNCFTKKFNIFFLSSNDILTEVLIFSIFAYKKKMTYLLNNVYSLLKKKRISRTLFFKIIQYVYAKHKMRLLVVLNTDFSYFFYKILNKISLPKIGFQSIVVSESYNLDYPLFIISYNIIYKFFFFYTICDLYLLSQKEYVKKMLYKFFINYLFIY